MMSLLAIALGTGRLFIMTYPQKIHTLCYNDLMDEPDIPTVAASQASGLSVDHVRSAVEQHRRGFRHLPGTGYHVAVVAWQAARLALEMERERV